jgi:hypothetical protein
MHSENFVINRDSPQAGALLDYLAGGGGLYLEGGNVWFEDPESGGHDFGPAFGITSLEGGTGMFPLMGVTGAAGTFAQGMGFAYHGDNFFVDQLAPIAPGFTLLRDPCTLIEVGVARDDGTCRTVGTSFEFAGLTDGAPPSTQGDLAAALMEFLTAPDPQATADGRAGRRNIALDCTHPSPLIGWPPLRYVLPRAGHLRLDLFDPAGRRVARLVDRHLTAGPHVLPLAQRPPAAGVYLLRAWFEGEIATGKGIVLH